MSIPIIVGFSQNNRVPGYYGETVYGAGAISAASIPLTLILVGTMGTGGTATPNQDIVPIPDANTADVAFLPGFELARMCYGALKFPGVTLFAAPVPEAGSAAAATQVITISGSWTATGQVTYRHNGVVYSAVVRSTDTIATACTSIAAQFNNNPRNPFTAAATATQVILTAKSKGARGNAFITFQDTSLAPSGFVSKISGSTWVASTAYTTTGPISFVVPVTANGYYYKCTTAGTTVASPEPTWPTTIGGTVTDGSVVWTCWGQILTGGATTMGGGVGTESVATLLAILGPLYFNRIVPAQNDATNLGLWLAQLTTQAGPTVGILGHLTTATNGSAAAANTLATGAGMNSQRMQLLNQVNGETAPWENAAWMGALRCTAEQIDPASAYDDVQVMTAVPQAMAADRPTNAILQVAINSGVTQIYTDPSGTKALICRSVTTHTLTGGVPDYRTLDTGDAYVPDFIRQDFGLYWSTVLKPNNPRSADDPPADKKELVAGILTPSAVESAATMKLRNYAKGILTSAATPVAATIAPIVIDVDDNLPDFGWDPVAKRIMGVIPCVPAPSTHQLGVSVRGVSSV